MSTLIVCALCSRNVRWLHWVSRDGIIVAVCEDCRARLKQAIAVGWTGRELAHLFFEAWRCRKALPGERLADRVVAAEQPTTP